LADKGFEDAVRADPVLRRGVNVTAGAVVLEEVAAAHGMPPVPPETVFGSGAD
jgi:alanine dehydrogenase